ncbi:YneF family protein [Marinilactibacillus piezotolerans]|uniref:YneF family protein n=1 Tax=Marinilactibacillus piezotolerans TaxID=258723 RepID=UPI0009B15038|nr:YneF family protein [Marinilactibacillus piezotolerans]
MPTFGWIILVIVALIGGLVGGFFISRKYMMDYFEKNPPIDENMLRMMMLQMGQKPSERKINQMMSQMKSQQRKKNNDKKK